MRLWQSRKTAQLEQERRAAEAARREARVQKARVRARNAQVQQVVSELERHRNTDRLAERIGAAFRRQGVGDASRTIGRLNSFSQELSVEADRRRSGGADHG